MWTFVADCHFLSSDSSFGLWLRSDGTGYVSYPDKLYMRIGLVFVLFVFVFVLSFPIRIMFISLWNWKTNLSGELFSEPRHEWTACPGRIRKNMCKHKAYPHKVFLDRNRIRLRVNKTGNLSRHVWLLFLSDETFFG